MSSEILIIDDNSDIRTILDELISDAGYKTRLAANFDQALSEIDKNIDIEIRQRRDYININIIDTGVGFKNKTTKELIKPYFTTKEKGTGLGLSIVDKIISDHNGSIQFLNHKKGAKIQIILPNK